MTAIRQLRGACIEPRPSFATRPCRLGLGGFSGFERRHQGIELGDTTVLAAESLFGFADGVLQRLQLGLRISPFGLGASERVRARRETGIVIVELAAELSFAMARSVELGTTHLFGASSTFEFSGGDSKTFLRLLQSRCRGPATRHTHAPPRRSEAVAVVGDDDDLRVGDRQVDGVGQGRNTHGGPDDGVEQLGNTLLAAAHVRPYRHTVLGQDDGRARRGTKCNHCTMHVRCVQRIEGPPPGLRRCDDHCLQRIAKRGFDRRLPAGVDVDEVEQRSQNILHAGQVLGTRASPGALQRKVQCLGSGSPSRRVVSCSLAAAVPRIRTRPRP